MLVGKIIIIIIIIRSVGIGVWHFFAQYKYAEDDDIHSVAIFQDKLDKPVPECCHSGFYWS